MLPCIGGCFVSLSLNVLVTQMGRVVKGLKGVVYRIAKVGSLFRYDDELKQLC